MDRPIDNQVKNSRRLKKMGVITISLLMLCFVFYGFKAWLDQPLDSAEFQLAQVVSGPIQERISASGLVVPAFEQLITSGLDTEIESVDAQTGAMIEKGAQLLRLNEAKIKSEYSQAKDALSLKRNNVYKLQLQLDKEIRELNFQQEILSLQLDQQRAYLIDLESLQQVGGTTTEAIEQAQLEIAISELEHKKLQNELDFKRQSLASEKENLELEVKIQEKQLAVLKDKLDKSQILAPRAGVLTWINQNIGQKVMEGEAIAKIADLDHFKVEAACSDRYAKQIKEGLPVIVRINRQDIMGQIDHILPSAENNQIGFVIQLEETDKDLLRPNLRVDVFAVVNEVKEALYLPNGAAFKGSKIQDLFVVKGDQAIKRSVEIGLQNSDKIEIVSGLSAGESVIISKTEKYEYLEEFKIK